MWAQTCSALAKLIEEEVHQLGVDLAVRLEIPPRRALGDLAWSGALQLAKALRRPPRELASQLARSLEEALAEARPPSPLAYLLPQVRVEGPGFLNFFLRRELALAAALRHGLQPQEEEAKEKVIVEHTNINPNKAAHIGHLRNAVLGDVLVRCLRFLGYQVEVQNYIDDTGVQVADVVVGFCFLPEEALVKAVQPFWPEVTSRAAFFAAFGQRWEGGHLVRSLALDDFDDLCWQLYPQVTSWYEREPQALAHRQEVLHALEAGGQAPLAQALAHLSQGERSQEALASFATAVAEANLRCHLLTMGALGIAYDVLPFESNILHLGFWQRTFALLQASGAVRWEKEGKNAGCWVMSLGESPEFAGEASADKVLVRSNGTVTYTGKDIAYQLWKLGLLQDEKGQRCDFGYAPFARFSQAGPAAPVVYGEGPRVLYRTTSLPQDQGPSFGAGQRVYNVIDVRQTYPQAVVREALKALGFPQQAAASVHFAYEMVALTPKAVHQLEESLGVSFDLRPEEEGKPYIEMSGRRGLGVKADELLQTLLREAEKAIKARHPEGQAPEDAAQRAWAIAVGALRYQMARQSRTRVLAFDFAEALAFEGDTGPYLQYAAVRAQKIFEKLGEAGLPAFPQEELPPGLLPEDLLELVLDCLRTPEVVEKAVASLEFSLLAGHARKLAQAFHNLYHRYPVLHAPSPQERALRGAVFRLFLQTMRLILQELLGIPVPAAM